MESSPRLRIQKSHMADLSLNLGPDSRYFRWARLLFIPGLGTLPFHYSG